MTFKILTDDTRHIVHRSVVRPASDDRFQNQRVRFDPDPDPNSIDSNHDSVLHTDPAKPRYQRAPLKFDRGLSQVPRPKQACRQHRHHQPRPTPNPDQSSSGLGSRNPRPHDDRGDPSDDDSEDEDDDDDGNNDDLPLDTQPPEPPPLLPRVYDVESPDEHYPHIPCDRGDSDVPVSDHDVARPPRTRTQVDRLTYNSRSHSSPLRLAAQALIIGLNLYSTYDLQTPMESVYVGDPLDINPDPTQFTLGTLTTRESNKL